MIDDRGRMSTRRIQPPVRLRRFATASASGAIIVPATLALACAAVGLGCAAAPRGVDPPPAPVASPSATAPGQDPTPPQHRAGEPRSADQPLVQRRSPTTNAELAAADTTLVVDGVTWRLDPRVIGGPTPGPGEVARPLQLLGRLVDERGAAPPASAGWRIDRAWVLSGPLVWTGVPSAAVTADGADAFTLDGGPAWRAGTPVRVVIRLVDSGSGPIGLLAAEPTSIILAEWNVN